LLCAGGRESWARGHTVNNAGESSQRAWMG
jgi:hypothetical protein